MVGLSLGAGRPSMRDENLERGCIAMSTEILENEELSVPSESAKPPKRKPLFKRVLFQIHLWSGMLTGLLMLIFGVTGSLLVFYPEIDDALNERLTRTAPRQVRAPLQTALEAAERAHPELRPQMISLPASEDRTIMIQMRARGGPGGPGGPGAGLSVYVDPYTGVVIGERNRNDSWLWQIRLLHSNLLMGRTGRLIVGICGLILALLCVTGIWLWYLGWKRHGRGLTVRWGASWKALAWDLHHAIGFYSLIIIFIVAVTGAYYAWPQEINRSIYSLTRSQQSPPPPRVSSQSNNSAPLPLDEIVRIADGALPQDRTTQVNLPASPEEPLVVIKQPPTEVSRFMRSRIFLDHRSGEILRIEDARQASLGARLIALVSPLHFGTVGGAITRWLWLIAGLVPPLLFITGFMMWWNRVVSKLKR
jgi:uncharacterized iron-regulated membrane protein